MNAKEIHITPVRLRLELTHNYLSDYEKRMLTRYGESTKDGAIVRDILIPSDMPLHNLHYAIQRLFGWQNSHLRNFTLPKDLYEQLTSGTVRGWSALVGELFQPPSQAENDAFWDDDYEKGSFKVWLKRKYTGPYVYGGSMEHPDVAKQDVEALLERFKMFDVQESFEDYMKRAKGNKNTAFKIVKRAPLIELTLKEMEASLMLPGGTESLLERLIVDEILANQGEPITDTHFFPVTDKLIYNYDYGDDWNITITKYKDCEDLITNNLIGTEELKEAENSVIDKHMPVCIYKEGLSVLDDVGGLSGFAGFLGTIYEGTDKEEATDSRKWARSQGWRAEKLSLNKML